MKFSEFKRGMGIGGWLTNYKRFNVLPQDRRLVLSPGDLEHFATYITRRDIDYIASLGFDHVRLGFDQIVLEEAAGKYRGTIFTLLDDFCHWCAEANLGVILNLHKAVGNYCDIAETETLFGTPALQERFVDMWKAMESHFADRPGIVFELLNETRDIAPEEWNSLAERTIETIRQLNASRRIIIGSTCWNHCGKLRFLPGFDENTGYAWHFYAPFEFTHQRGVLQADPLYYNRSMFYPGDIEPYRDYQRFVHGKERTYGNYHEMGIAFLRDSMQDAFDFAAAHPDRFVWCGEFGTIRHAPPESRVNYMRDIITLLKEHNMPYCVWNYLSTPNDGNRFSLMDDDSRRILSPALHDALLGR